MLTSLRRLFIFPVLSLGLVVAGCAETELAFHAAKKLKSPSGKHADGAYKIGKPYQVDGVWYYPKPDYAYRETGIASWYGPGFHGKKTANGERYDQNTLTGAHRTLPMPTIVRVTNLGNGRSIKVRINDRGPFSNGRIIDLSQRGADLLDFRRNGTAKVLVEIVEDESRRLAASTQTDETETTAPAPAPRESVATEVLPGIPAPTQAATPAASQTAAVVPQRANTVVAQPTLAPVLDETVTTQPVHPTSIFVQAGSFTRIDNALRLRARLSRLGNVHVAEATIDNRHYFRVRIGPMASVSEADEFLAILLGNGHPGARVIVD